MQTKNYIYHNFKRYTENIEMTWEGKFRDRSCCHWG